MGRLEKGGPDRVSPCRERGAASRKELRPGKEKRRGKRTQNSQRSERRRKVLTIQATSWKKKPFEVIRIEEGRKKNKANSPLIGDRN